MEWLVAAVIGAIGVAMIWFGATNNPGGLFNGLFGSDGSTNPYAGTGDFNSHGPVDGQGHNIPATGGDGGSFIVQHMSQIGGSA